MDALTMGGYRTISLDQWLDHRDGRLASPDCPLVVTFDDGYLRSQRVADPGRAACARHGVSSRARSAGATRDTDELREPASLARRASRVAGRRGHFGSHSFAPAAGEDRPGARDELSAARGVVGPSGRNVDTLAYPFSNQSRDLRRLVRDAGYRGAVRGADG